MLNKPESETETGPELVEFGLAETVQVQKRNAMNQGAKQTVWFVSKGYGKGRERARKMEPVRKKTKKVYFGCTSRDFTERCAWPDDFESDEGMGGRSEGEAETGSEKDEPASSSQARAWQPPPPGPTDFKRQVQQQHFLSCMTCWPFRKCCLPRRSRAGS